MRMYALRLRLRFQPHLVVVAVCAMVAAFGGESAPDGPESPSPSGGKIVSQPREVFCGSRVRLLVPQRFCPDPAITEFEWTASGGLLLYDDLRVVEWRAPARAGKYRVSVKFQIARRAQAQPQRQPQRQPPPQPPPREWTLVVDVRAPKTAGMVWVPAGVGIRGDIAGTRDVDEVKTIQNASDEPFHRVFLDGFWIDRHPVTNQQYRDFLNAAVRSGLCEVEEIGVMGWFEGSRVPFYYLQPYDKLIKDYWLRFNARKPHFLHVLAWDPRARRFSVKPGHANRPVVDVTWFGSAAYANFHGKQLPSEAQWEKAARGTDGRRFPWGDYAPAPYVVNLNQYLGQEPTPVGIFSPGGDSPYGVADMFSGIFEWTNDWFNADYYGDYKGVAPLRNPTGPFWGKAHSIRGLPSALFYPGSTLEELEPVSSRYDWRFEFFIGDSFANRQTGFRTVALAAAPVAAGVGTKR